MHLAACTCCRQSKEELMHRLSMDRAAFALSKSEPDGRGGDHCGCHSQQSRIHEAKKQECEQGSSAGRWDRKSCVRVAAQPEKAQRLRRLSR